MVVTNLSIAPGVFNINEPTMFGLPIVLNPIMFIPFILTPMVLVSVAYFATSTGLVPAATVMPPWVTPPIIGGVLATKSIAGGVLAAVNLVLSILIYLPFVKVATIQERRKSFRCLINQKRRTSDCFPFLSLLLSLLIFIKTCIIFVNVLF